MNNMELETDVDALDMEMDVNIHYCPVIPNPEGEPTAELKTADIEGTIYKIVDEEARTELENKVDKVDGKDLSTNDYTDEDKAIVDGVTEALNGKVDKDGDKVLSDNNYSDEDKAIVDGVTSALNDKADKSDTYTKTEVDSALDNKVDKVEGKGLSENDFTDTLKDKLDGIEEQANKTVVDNSVTATSTNPVESKAIYNLLNDLLPEATETGNPISITNASGFNAKALTVDMLPIQDLHGYDKPWAGGSGKNLVDYPNVSIPLNGGFVFNTSFNGESGDYTVSFDFNADNSGQLLFRLYSGTTIVGEKTANYSSGTSRVVATATASQNFDSWRAYVNQSGSVSKIMVAKGSYSTYEPYSNICPISGRNSLDITVNGNTETINLGETVYGGTCDVVNGGTSNKYGYVVLDGSSDEGWNVEQSGTTYSFKHTIEGAYSENGQRTPVICDKAIYISSGNAVGGAFIYGANNSAILYLIIDQSITTIEAFRTYLSNNPYSVTYELATPTTINTPANEISLLKGNNTIVGDGDMELIYSKIPQ